MSHPGDIPASGVELETLADAFAAVLGYESNKPDTKDFLDLNSPVISPLRARSTSTCLTNTTGSSSSSSGSSTVMKTGAKKPEAGLAGRRSHSGEIPLGSNETSPNAGDGWNLKPGHRRTGSGPLIFTGGSTWTGSCSSTASSPTTNVLPSGNICPSGKVSKMGIIHWSAPRSDMLRSGTANYGHGNIVRAGWSAPGGGKSGEVAASGNDDLTERRVMKSVDPEEVKRAGNEQYKKGHFREALKLYDRVVMMCPDNAVCRSNRAAALVGLGRLGEAMKECEEALRLDPAFGRANQRLASLHIRLGQVKNAWKHLFLASAQPDLVELQKLQAVEKYLGRCADARKIGDWKSALRESDAAIAAGADSSPMLIASRAEALLWLHQLDEADLAISNAIKLVHSFLPCSETKFFGLLADSYIFFVHAQVEMALGRLKNAVAAAEKARKMDPENAELTAMLSNVKAVAGARALGNELFNSGKFAEASLAYGEGLKYNPLNPVLYCNRAACRFKLGQWAKSIEDCNEALRIQPNYTKALLRRAASYGKIEQWAESVRDYEVLRRELPGDAELAEALFHAQVALKKTQGEQVSNLKFGGEVEEITGIKQFQMAVTLPGVSVVHFMVPSNHHCSQITPFVDALCMRYPLVNFLQVDVNESPDVAEAENVRTVPTFNIYKNSVRVKEMICPSQQVLEYSVRRYGMQAMKASNQEVRRMVAPG